MECFKELPLESYGTKGQVHSEPAVVRSGNEVEDKEHIPSTMKPKDSKAQVHVVSTRQSSRI